MQTLYLFPPPLKPRQITGGNTMKRQDNQKTYFIYIRSTGEKVPVTKEQHDCFYREASRIRNKEQNHHRCMCPYRFIWKCDGDCIGCEYHAAGDTLYYLDEGVRRMQVTADALPSGVFIPAGDRLFYKLIAGPRGMVAVTDAIDYQQKGDLLIFSSSGELTDSGQAGIIPGFMLYRKE